jgi:2-oxoglutarate ferredoxin oxidoreductase subunit beta
MNTPGLAVMQRTSADYKSEVRPVWCPGCGHYGVLASILKALAEQGLDPEKVALISGIGCSSRIPAYTKVYGFHSVHGRSLPIATGVKIARPDLTVIVAGGDGDGFSIGGNHFLHACRRNVDMTYVVMDNQVYGMTKGQASPTTAEDWEGSELTPEGTGINPLQPLGIALASGANFIARCLSRDINRTAKTIIEANQHPGFSFVQVLSPCVTYHPEHQKQWRDYLDKNNTSFEPAYDSATAAKALMNDDGYTLGVLFKGKRKPYAPGTAAKKEVAELHADFAL